MRLASNSLYWFSLYLILDRLYLLGLYLSICTFSVFTWWCKTLLQKSLPMLRQSMQLGRMSIDGIRPPPHEVVITTTTSQATPATVHRPQIAAQPTAIVRPPLVGWVLIALFCVCVVIVYCQRMIVEHCLELLGWGGGGGVVSSFECMSFLFVHFLLFLKCSVGACSVSVDFFNCTLPLPSTLQQREFDHFPCKHIFDPHSHEGRQMGHKLWELSRQNLFLVLSGTVTHCCRVGLGSRASTVVATVKCLGLVLRWGAQQVYTYNVYKINRHMSEPVIQKCYSFAI